MTQTDVTDAEIVAFLDDALPTEDQARIALAATTNPDVAQRIEALSVDRDQLVGAFEELLSTAPTLPVTQPPANKPAAPAKWWQAAAAIALLAIGIGIGTQLPKDDATDWHMAVADYQVLYATETLTGMELTQDQRWGSLAKTSATLGLDLDREDVTLTGLQFRRAQLLSHQGAPLAQLAFLDTNGDAIAFCFTRTNGPDTDAEPTTLAGLNAITWQKKGIGFILIGGDDAEALKTWQTKLASATEA